MAGGTRPRFLDPGETNRGDSIMAEQAKEPVVGLTMEQLKELIATAAGAQSGLTPESLAQALAATQKRENARAPMVSAFNPKGETAHPRPAFSAKTVTQNGVALNTDQMTWEEIEAVNALPGGSFRVTKANGTSIPFAVQITRGLDEHTVERKDITFPCRDEHARDHRGILDYCLEVLESADPAAHAAVADVVREMKALRKTAGLAA